LSAYEEATLASGDAANADQASLENSPRIVFVSIDPDRDTPEVIGEYLSRFDMPVTGLTGEIEALDDISAEYGVVFYKEFPEGVDPEAPEPADSYAVVHTGTVFLVDALGMVRATYREPFSPEDIAWDLRLLDEEVVVEE
jgi:protein SCO1/2